MFEEIAVIILNFNDAKKTVKCILSFLKAGILPNSIYLVDNNSSEQESRELYKSFNQIKFFQLKENNGYAAGNNFGINIALNDGYKYFLISNNDVIVNNNTVKVLSEELKKSDKTGVVTCKVLYKDSPNIINAAGGRFNKILCTGENLKIGNQNDNNLEIREIEFVPGMIFLIKKEVIQKIGLMREDFFMYFEDLEYSFRIKKYFKMIYTSETSVFHDSGGGLRGKSYSALYLYYYTRNRLKLFKSFNKIYYFYVVIFSLINAATKISIVLKTDDKKQIKSIKIKNLIKGIWHGLIA